MKMLNGSELIAKRINLLCAILIAVEIVLTVLLSSVPPISRDALVHHLAVPKIYIEKSGIHEIPSMDFSYFPMNLDLLYLIPIYFDAPIAAKYIHFAFAILTAWLLFRYLKDKLDSTYGLLGALLFLSIPVIVKLSVTVYVDLGLIFFSWASIYYFLKWIDHDFKPAYLLLSAVFCGLCLGTKYNGLIFLFIMVSLIPLFYSFIRNNTRASKDNVNERYKNSLKGLRVAVIFAVVSLIVFSPWMVRNMVWKGNPVYPLFKNVFNQEETETIAAGALGEKRPPRNAFWTRRHLYKESIWQTITIPVRVFFQGKDDNPKYFDGILNPALLFFPIFAFLGFRRKRQRSIPILHRNFLAVFSILFILFVLFKVDFRIRYMVPAIPALVALSIFGLRNIVDLIADGSLAFRRISFVALLIIIALTYFYNGMYIHQQFEYIKPIEYLSGRIDKDTYITRYRMEHPVVMYANNQLPNDAKVLCLSLGKRTYYIDRDVHLALDFYRRKNGVFTESLIVDRLKRYETSHVLFNRNNYLRWVRNLSPYEISAFESAFRKNTKVIYEKDGVQLLEIV